MSILKRQRELQKAEKAARKRARRHGERIPESAEPGPTEAARVLFGGGRSSDETRPYDDDNER
jgi:hypothetical protein